MSLPLSRDRREGNVPLDRSTEGGYSTLLVSQFRVLLSRTCHKGSGTLKERGMGPFWWAKRWLEVYVSKKVKGHSRDVFKKPRVFRYGVEQEFRRWCTSIRNSFVSHLLYIYLPPFSVLPFGRMKSLRKNVSPQYDLPLTCRQLHWL